jgi:ribosome-associated translation inhibitor RaiA
MRISLTGTDVIITDQLQTYAEYRLFTSIARYHDLIRRVQVTLGSNPVRPGRFICVVAVDLGPDEQITIRASGRHPNAAIDRAAHRTSVRLSGRASHHVSS